MTIARRLTLLLSIPLILLLALAFFVTNQIANVEGLTHFVVEEQVPSLAVLADI